MENKTTNNNNKTILKQIIIATPLMLRGTWQTQTRQ